MFDRFGNTSIHDGSDYFMLDSVLQRSERGGLRGYGSSGTFLTLVYVVCRHILSKSRLQYLRDAQVSN